MNFFRVLLWLLLACPYTLWAQGEWKPDHADFTFPRTLCKTTELDSIKACLLETPFSELYSGVYENAFQSIPANAVNSDRGTRAAMAKNAAFVLLLNSKTQSGSIRPLSDAEKDTLLRRSLFLLFNINASVEKITVTVPTAYEQWQWRSKELINYLTAYDLLKGAGVSDSSLGIAKDLLQEFAGNLYTESNRSIFGLKFFGTVYNNHALMTAAALGMAAVVLNDATDIRQEYQPQNWLNCAVWNIEDILWRNPKRQSEPDQVAGYAEGPYYFRYAFANCLPFFRAMGHFLPASNQQPISYVYSNSVYSIPNPYYDKRYEMLYQWVKDIRMPDGRLPALDDTYMDTGFPELALTGKRQYLWPMDFSRLSPQQADNLNRQLLYTYDLRADYVASHLRAKAIKDSGLISHTASGDIVFRSGSGASATYFHLESENGRARTSGGGHNHADETSFILYSNGQLLALDPGNVGYDRKGEVDSATNHNMILVDGKGPGAGSPGNAGGADVFSKDIFAGNGLSHAQVTTSYDGAYIFRDVLFIRNRYFLLHDAAVSSSVHAYTWQLHGYGLNAGDSTTGKFYDYSSTGKAVWEKNGVKLLAHVVGNDEHQTYTNHAAEHELTWNKTENHTVLNLTTGEKNNARFLSLLEPFNRDSVWSYGTSKNGFSSIRIKDSVYHDFAFSKEDSGNVILAQSETGLSQTLKTDAVFSFVSEDSLTSGKQLYLSRGTGIDYEKIHLKASHRMNIWLSQESAGVTKGYVSDSGKLILYSEYYVKASGDKLMGSDFNLYDSTIELDFAGAGKFELEIAEAPLSTPGLETEKGFQLFPNPAYDYVGVKFGNQHREKLKQILIMDCSGRVLKKIQTEQEIIRIYTGDLAPGIYLVSNRLHTSKLVIRR